MKELLTSPQRETTLFQDKSQRFNSNFATEDKFKRE